MAGAYCRFCDHRCFVERRMPDDALNLAGQTVHLATCPAGAEYDRAQCGYDYDTAINPHACATTGCVRRAVWYSVPEGNRYGNEAPRRCVECCDVIRETGAITDAEIAAALDVADVTVTAATVSEG